MAVINLSAKQMARLSDNGRLAVAAGNQPGTKSYVNYMRYLQRTTTTTGTQTRSGSKSAAKLAQLPQAEQAQLQTRQAIRNVIKQAIATQGRTAANPLPLAVTVKGKIQVGDSEAEKRRPARDVRITIQSAEQLAILAAGDLVRFLKYDFYGDPDSTYPLYVSGATVRAGHQ